MTYTMAEIEAKYPERNSAALRAEIDGILAAIFRECPAIDLILMFGYTPGFNDGEPCEHDQETVVQDYCPCEPESAFRFFKYLPSEEDRKKAEDEFYNPEY